MSNLSIKKMHQQITLNDDTIRLQLIEERFQVNSVVLENLLVKCRPVSNVLQHYSVDFVRKRDFCRFIHRITHGDEWLRCGSGNINFTEKRNIREVTLYLQCNQSINQPIKTN